MQLQRDNLKKALKQVEAKIEILIMVIVADRILLDNMGQ
jgi:hypothetical protein